MEVRKKTNIAKMMKEQAIAIRNNFENELVRNKWVDRELVQTIIPSFISKVHSNMKIVAETTLTDIGKKNGISFGNMDYKVFQDSITEMMNLAIEQMQIGLKKEEINNFMQ